VNQTATGPDRIAAELAADLDAGFAALFEAHQNVLFSTALRICGRWADAEDLTATAFLRAFRALSGYDRERIAALRTRPWLLTILLNASPPRSPGGCRPGRRRSAGCSGR
jgi:DNA-directed RNA polymerase specialized sigma24 family protein